MKFKGIIIGIVTLAVAIIAGVIIKNVYSSKPSWIALRKGPIVEAIYGLGTVTSDREFRVKPGVATTLSRVMVKEGDAVKKGTPLLKLADQPTIVAPFDGTVTSIPFKEGENIFPQVAILSMVDLRVLYLSMSIEQSAALLVRKNQKAVLMFESQRNQKFDGVVDAIIPKDGQFVVNILVEHLPDGILPGMTADTSITVGHKEDAILIPLKSIQGFKVKFKHNGKIEKKDVKLGVVSGDWAELIDPVFSDPSGVEVAIQP